MSRLFGTDGIRGRAGSFPLDRLTVWKIGRALARNRGEAPRVLIGRDTRASSPELERWLASGIQSVGGVALSAGVIPTPAIAFLTRRQGFSSGVMLSASHNPFEDNGIKILSTSGSKSSEELEATIEGAVESETARLPEGRSPAPLESDPLYENIYLDHLSAAVGDQGLPAWRIALDCANGAAYEAGPKLLSALDLAGVVMSNEPDGKNINAGCGSTHPEGLAARVLEERCDLGAAVDGDGDRLILVDEKGNVVDGDSILLVCGRWMKQAGRLAEDGIVATVMSNMALEVALDELGIALHRTAVGDRFVAEEMERRSANLGGEQSGHIIFSDYATTGDGLLTLVQVLRAMASSGRRLSDLNSLEPYPQILVNIQVSRKPAIDEVPGLSTAIREAESTLDGRGRVLVRYSGTESLLRIMMEGPDLRTIESLAENIGEVARRTIGAP